MQKCNIHTGITSGCFTTCGKSLILNQFSMLKVISDRRKRIKATFLPSSLYGISCQNDQIEIKSIHQLGKNNLSDFRAV